MQPTKPNQKANFQGEFSFCTRKQMVLIFPAKSKSVILALFLYKFCKYNSCTDGLLSPKLEKPSLNILSGKSEFLVCVLLIIEKVVSVVLGISFNCKFILRNQVHCYLSVSNNGNDVYRGES